LCTLSHGVMCLIERNMTIHVCILMLCHVTVHTQLSSILQAFANMCIVLFYLYLFTYMFMFSNYVNRLSLWLPQKIAWNDVICGAPEQSAPDVGRAWLLGCHSDISDYWMAVLTKVYVRKIPRLGYELVTHNIILVPRSAESYNQKHIILGS